VTVREGQTGALLDDPADVSEIAVKLAPLLRGEHAPVERIAESVAPYAWDRVLIDYERVLKESVEHAIDADAVATDARAPWARVEGAGETLASPR
ncbi:MAG: hypothetical protein ACREIT_05070, partial [Tepidisphaeraceae bacterium]